MVERPGAFLLFITLLCAKVPPITPGGRRRETLLGLPAVLGSFVVTELSVLWPTQRPFGPVIILFVAGAAGVTLLGSPVFLLGGVTEQETARTLTRSCPGV